VSGLEDPLARLARSALWLSLPVPGLTVFLSWYQGNLVHRRRTRGITESVALYLVVNAVLLGIAVRALPVTGIYVGLTSILVGVAAQAAWLHRRSGPALERGGVPA
jgi:hypothetical protein